MGQSPSPPSPIEWQTRAEKSDYRETPRYDETMAYCEKLDAASPLIRFSNFGRSGEGRPLPLIIAATGGTFTRESARKAGKAIVLVQACIHPGEPDGKDAGLALLRDIAITKTRPGLLDNVVLLFIPIYNADGHERFGPYNRINQNGPTESGWRGTTTNLNLNRDYMKADAPETRAWLKMWTDWDPDLFIDCHVTDGADFRYNITYQYEHHDNAPPSVREWMKNAIEGHAVPASEANGNLLSTYLVFKDNRDFTKGIVSFISTPRFSTGYAPLRNRPGLLIETHMLKEFRSRVRGTYDLLWHILEEVNRDPQSLLRAVRLADEQCIADGSFYNASRRYPLRFEFTDKSIPFELKAVEYRTELSEVSGAVRVIYGTKPLDMTVPLFDDVKATVSVPTPLYYIIPPQWQEVIGVLRAHGIRLRHLGDATTLDVESYRFSGVKWATSSFEGHVMPTYKSEVTHEKRTYPVGSVVVSMAQPAARVALYLLEPDAPDSFVTWGFFNPIFEEKEYAEDYVMEKLAREMLTADANLRREFEQRVANDPDFAGSASERLRFFYMRSPFWDKQLNVYPVGRVTSRLDEKLFARD
jgi:murein tripeptide amidase MpaA